MRQLTGTPARFRWVDRAVYFSGWAGVGMAAIFLMLSKPVALVMVGAYVGYSAITNTWIAWLEIICAMGESSGAASITWAPRRVASATVAISAGLW